MIRAAMMIVLVLTTLSSPAWAAEDSQEAEIQAMDDAFEKKRRRQDKEFSDSVEAQEKVLREFRKRMAKEVGGMARKMADGYLRDVRDIFEKPKASESEKSLLVSGVEQGIARDTFLSKVVPEIRKKTAEHVQKSLRSADIQIDDKRAREMVKKLADEALEVETKKPTKAKRKSGTSLFRQFVEKKNKPLEIPVKPPRIGQRNSMFGKRNLKVGGRHLTSHCGLDMPHPEGTPVIAMGDGRVSAIGGNKTAGKFVIVKADVTNEEGGAIYYSMSHLIRTEKGLKDGDRIKKGQVLGEIGNTGRSTGAHLHLAVKEVHQGKQRFVNPYKWVHGLPVPKNLEDSWLQYEYCSPLLPVPQEG